MMAVRQLSVVGSSRPLWALVLLPAFSLGVACGPLEDEELTDEDTSALPIGGLSINGLSANGLSANGLSANGLSANGLSANGLGTISTGWGTKFNSWCNSHISDGLCNNVMTYVVKCACNAGITRSFSGTKSYSWVGQWGVADGFCAGSPATVPEQERLTACVLAHVNSKSGSGFSMTVSLTEQSGSSSFDINSLSQEQQVMATHEATYYGNFWTDQKHACYSWSFNSDDTLLMTHYGRNCGWGGCSGTGITKTTGCGCFMGNSDGSTECSDGPWATAKHYPGAFVRNGQYARIKSWVTNGLSVGTMELYNGATTVTAPDGQLAAKIPYDIDAYPAKIQDDMYWTKAGYTHRVQVGYYNSSGTTKYCTLSVTHSNGATTKTVNATFPSGSGMLVKDVSMDFVPTVDSFATFKARSYSGLAVACPNITSVLISMR